MLRRWRPTAWPQSPFLDIDPPTSGRTVAAAHERSLHDAAKGTRKLAAFFGKRAASGELEDV